MPENEIDYNKVNVDDIVKSAMGDKPTALKKSFDNEMINRVNDIIMGKRDAIHKDMFGDQSLKAEPDDDEVLEAEPTEDEIEQAIDDSDETDEVESEEQPEAEQEEEPEEDLRAEFEATLEPDSEEEPEEEKNETS